ncbi:MAG: phytanoyl-CoA dioxygenase family protein [Pseudomonadota bacterium]
MNVEEKFESDGFVVIKDILSENELHLLSDRCDSEIKAQIGTRNLLDFAWVRGLARTLKLSESLKPLMPTNPVAVQCNYFAKDSENNWSVTPHRDLSIPVKKQIKSEGWSGWSVKEGVLYAQPPKQVLAQMMGVRIHLEANDSQNGALELVAGSHKNFIQRGERSLGIVPKGGALVMRPLVLHASTKLKSGKRRVLHFVFGPRKLPDDMEWAIAI